MTESWEFGEETPQEPTSPEPGFPWPPEEDEPILAAVGATWKGATIDPGRFFSRTPRDRGTGPALLYYLALGILLAGATLFWDSMGFMANAAGSESLAGEFGYGAVSPLVRFLLSPVILLVALYLSAGVVHLLLLMFGGAKHGFGTTVRVFCYAYSPALFGIVPLVGPLVGGVWSVVISIIGLREAHQAATWKPVVAVLVPLVVSMVFFMLVVIAAVMATGGMVPPG
jgi:hypothetical protein